MAHVIATVAVMVVAAIIAIVIIAVTYAGGKADPTTPAPPPSTMATRYHYPGPVATQLPAHPVATRKPRPMPTLDELLGDTEVPPDLQTWMDMVEGEPRIVKVTAGVYQATNYGFANSHLVVGDTGVVVVDTMDSVSGATEVMKAYRKITDLPIKAILYTHYHPDHHAGTEAFVDGMRELPEIWAHKNRERVITRAQVRAGTFAKRVYKHFGALLGKYRVSQTFLLPKFVDDRSPTHYKATHLLDQDELNMNVGGVNMTLMYLPGETADHMGLWMPKIRWIHLADNMYTTLPTMYSIRGAMPRDPMDWIAVLDKIIEMKPLIMSGGHIPPMYGEEKIRAFVQEYRDATKYYHDQAVRFMNRGVHPIDIGNQVVLPEEYHDHPYLMEVYGPERWSLQGVVSKYTGCFSGNAEELNLLSPKERGDRMVRMFGREALVEAGDRALDQNDPKFALELATHLHEVDKTDQDAIRIRGYAFKALGSNEPNFAARNFYMMAIMEDFGELPEIDYKKQLLIYSHRRNLEAMTRRLKAENVEGLDYMACFAFPDKNETFTMHIHNSIADLHQPQSPRCDVGITTDEETFRHILAGKLSLYAASSTNRAFIKGGVANFDKFLGYFDEE